jgi:hydroxymethylpyrimidine/phosphomethylpyrimidine kinase
MKTVLTIAGFDPSSGAGVTADLMVFAAHSLFGTACITALTVQSTVGVQSSHPVSAAVVAATLDHLNSDLPPAGIKIGMISTEDNLHEICNYLEIVNNLHEEAKSPRTPVVLDPVINSTSGRELLSAPGVKALRERLLPLVDWVTPNLAELAALTGEPVDRRDQIPRACQILQTQVAKRPGGPHLGVFATGGHLDPPDDFLQLPSGDGLWLPGERIDTRATHGTGCALSSAFLSRLVLGDPPQEAALRAKRYIAGALRAGIERGSGYSPINHLWDIANL